MIRVKTEFDAKQLRKRVEQGSYESLQRASGAIRLTAVRSIRRSKKPSAPGSPPHTPTGALKRVIRYAVDPSKTTADIGPINVYARTIWHLHEFGGTTRKRLKLLKQKRFEVGQFGPVRKVGNRFTHVRLRTEAQVQRATKLVEQENQERTVQAQRILHYPARPFMGPALEALRSRLPKFWANSVRA